MDAINDRIETVVEKVVALRPDGSLVVLKSAKLGFGYRTSIFQRPPFFIVYRARLKLRPSDPATVWRIIDLFKNGSKKISKGGRAFHPRISPLRVL